MDRRPNLPAMITPDEGLDLHAVESWKHSIIGQPADRKHRLELVMSSGNVIALEGEAAETLFEVLKDASLKIYFDLTDAQRQERPRPGIR